MKRLAVALGLALALVTILPVFAQSPEDRGPIDKPQAPIQSEIISPAEVVNIAIGEAKLIKFNRMVGEVQTSVNNIIRSSVMPDKYLLSITGVSPGVTDLIVVNQYSDVIYLARVNVSAGLQADNKPPHIVRTYGWSDPGGKKGGNSIVTIVNGDSKGNGNSDQNPDFVERYCSSSGCSQPLNRAAQGAGLDRTDPLGAK